MKSLKIKKGDRVKVIAGNDKGAIGEVPVSYTHLTLPTIYSV